MDHAAQRVRKTGAVDTIQNDLTHSKEPPCAFATRFEIKGFGQTTPLLAARCHGLAGQKGIVIGDHIGSSRDISRRGGRYGRERRKSGIRHLGDRLSFLAKQSAQGALQAVGQPVPHQQRLGEQKTLPTS